MARRSRRFGTRSGGELGLCIRTCIRAPIRSTVRGSTRTSIMHARRAMSSFATRATVFAHRPPRRRRGLLPVPGRVTQPLLDRSRHGALRHLASRCDSTSSSPGRMPRASAPVPARAATSTGHGSSYGLRSACSSPVPWEAPSSTRQRCSDTSPGADFVDQRQASHLGDEGRCRRPVVEPRRGAGLTVWRPWRDSNPQPFP